MGILNECKPVIRSGFFLFVFQFISSTLFADISIEIWMKHETTFRNVVPFNQLSIYLARNWLYSAVSIFSVQNWLIFVGECIKHTIDGAVDGLHSVIFGDFWLRFDALIRLIAFHSLNLINEEKIPLIFPIWVS